MAYKQLDTPVSSHWKSPLLNDIGFIKKHLRYPVNKRTILSIIPILAGVCFLLLVTVIIVLSVTDHSERFTLNGSNIVAILSIGIVLFTMAMWIYRRVQTLRFLVVSSPFMLTENIHAIRQFLEQQHIAYFHHPDAPEVFQISSRLLDAATGQREIMVFLADERRILLNSHFSSEGGDRGMKEIASNERRRMAKALQQWLEQNTPDRPDQFRRKIMGR